MKKSELRIKALAFGAAILMISACLSVASYADGGESNGNGEYDYLLNLGIPAAHLDCLPDADIAQMHDDLKDKDILFSGAASSEGESEGISAYFDIPDDMTMYVTEFSEILPGEGEEGDRILEKHIYVSYICSSGHPSHWKESKIKIRWEPLRYGYFSDSFSSINLHRANKAAGQGELSTQSNPTLIAQGELEYYMDDYRGANAFPTLAGRMEGGASFSLVPRSPLYLSEDRESTFHIEYSHGNRLLLWIATLFFAELAALILLVFAIVAVVKRRGQRAARANGEK